MKSCPVCQASCFDDMEVCYACMHRFAAHVTQEGPRPDHAGKGEDGSLHLRPLQQASADGMRLSRQIEKEDVLTDTAVFPAEVAIPVGSEQPMPRERERIASRRVPRHIASPLSNGPADPGSEVAFNAVVREACGMKGKDADRIFETCYELVISLRPCTKGTVDIRNERSHPVIPDTKNT